MSRLLVRASCIAGVGLGASWLLLAGSSPLSGYLTGHPLITNIASAVNLPTIIFALSGFPGSAAPSNAAVALIAAGQWLVYGWAAAWLWPRARRGFPP